MRILIAHSFYRLPGGEDRYVEQQAALLGPHHEVDLLAARNEDINSSLRAATRMTYSPATVREVEDRVRRFRPDLIHLHNPYPALGPAVHLAAERCKIPIVMTVHNHRLRCPNGLMFTQGELCQRCEKGNHLNAVVHKCFPTRGQASVYATALWLHRFTMKLERKVALFIAPSEYMEQRLREWGLGTGHVETIRHFTGEVEGDPGEPGSFGLYVGRLSAEKGLTTLLEALRVAGDPEFKIVGDGPAERDLIAMAESMGLQNTQFLGRLDADRLNSIYSECRYVTMPSLSHESAGLALLEAMMRSRPILVTRRGGLPELAGADRGLVCEPAAADDMAAKISRYAGDPAFARETGKRAGVWARSNVTPEVHRAGLERAYELVLG